jgi:hypothetical protein
MVGSGFVFWNGFKDPDPCQNLMDTSRISSFICKITFVQDFVVNKPLWFRYRWCGDLCDPVGSIGVDDLCEGNQEENQ